MKISRKKYQFVLFDGCHKFYLIKDKKEKSEIIKNEGRSGIYSIEKLPKLWLKSCPLRFINENTTLKSIIPQCSRVKSIVITD